MYNSPVATHLTTLAYAFTMHNYAQSAINMQITPFSDTNSIFFAEVCWNVDTYSPIC